MLVPSYDGALRGHHTQGHVHARRGIHTHPGIHQQFMKPPRPAPFTNTWYHVCAKLVHFHTQTGSHEFHCTPSRAAMWHFHQCSSAFGSNKLAILQFFNSIVENFRGRKHSRILWFLSHLQKFSPRNLGMPYPPIYVRYLYSAKWSLLSDPWKFSPSKIFCYIVC